MVSNEKKDLLSSGRRDKTEIIAAIVAVTLKPSPATRIMSSLNTNHSTCNEYLNFMVEAGLIRKVDRSKNERVFEATDKGVIFLKKYCDILKMLYGSRFLESTNNLAVVCLELSDVPTEDLNGTN
jgi:predicted transcriptional regulator